MENKIDNRYPANKVTNTALLVVSCDAYKDLWEPYFHCLFKYWPDCPYPVFLGSNESGHPDTRVKSILVGPDRGYSSNLIAMLDQINYNWVILWVEDAFLSAPIETSRLSTLVTTAQERRAGYLKLMPSHPWAFPKKINEEIGIIPKGIKYRVGIGISLWNKDVLKSVIRSGETAWEIERNGSSRSMTLNVDFYCLSASVKFNPPLAIVHAVVKGKWTKNAIPFLRKEGFSDYILKRNVQSFWSHVYIKLYQMRLNIYRVLGVYWYE